MTFGYPRTFFLANCATAPFSSLYIYIYIYLVVLINLLLNQLIIAPRSLQERLLRTRRTFLVDASTISSWKKLARHENPSTFVCIAARVLVTVASVRGFADDDGPLISAFLSDCRSRLDPPIDDGYTGNCVSYCFASMTASEVARPDGFVPACIALTQVRFDANLKILHWSFLLLL